LKNLLLVLLFAISPAATIASETPSASQRPNIVWIVGDDLGVQIAPYGDVGAITPTLDHIAKIGTHFSQTFAASPTCSPSRSALITSRYPTEIGTHHHRSRLTTPPQTMLELLAAAGYHIAWPESAEHGKTDFNFDSPPLTKAITGWPNESPSEPFFAYFNDMVVHEGKLLTDDAAHQRLTAELSPTERQNPRSVTIPPYFPDTPEVRQSFARYGELVTLFDRNVGNLLTTLRKQGVLERTVIMVFGDNGAPFPRGKRFLYEAGIRVPLLIMGPGIDRDVVRTDLVSLLDIAPTTLALAGVKPPPTMAGRVLVGPEADPPPSFVIATRDRTDEALDIIRAVHDGRFLYIRNFMPDVPQSSSLPAYSRGSRVWKSLVDQHALGALDAMQQMFFAERKPEEELYDVLTDPHQVHNLAGVSDYDPTLKRMRDRLTEWKRSHDTLGESAEPDLMQRGVLSNPSRTTIVPFGTR
jgi:arylsulfatase A-like enzyme